MYTTLRDKSGDGENAWVNMKLCKYNKINFI